LAVATALRENHFSQEENSDDPRSDMENRFNVECPLFLFIFRILILFKAKPTIRTGYSKYLVFGFSKLSYYLKLKKPIPYND